LGGENVYLYYNVRIMKWIIVITLSLLFNINLSVLGQKIRFSDSTNVWHGYNWDDADVPYYSYPWTYNYVGSIIINDTFYRLLGSSSFLIREDTNSNKVYLSENVLYDYNLHFGDTFYYSGAKPHIVSQIDSVLINSVWHKTWQFVPINDSSVAGGMPAEYDVIEGIGCLNNPFYPTQPVFFEAHTTLTCFNNKGTTPPLSHNVGDYFDNYISCNLTFGAGIKNISAQQINPELIPNPINELSKIIFPYTISKGSFEIVNFTGEIIAVFTVNNIGEISVGDKITIPGIYFYQVIDFSSGNLFSGKFLKL